MAVVVRPYKGDTTGKRWEVDIRFDWPQDGTPFRRRFKSPCRSEKASEEWGEKKQAGLLARGPERPAPPTPPRTLLKDLGARYLEHLVAERKKPATIRNHRSMLRAHILPELGERPVAELGEQDVLALKLRLKNHRPGSANQLLICLSRVLQAAQLWGLRGPVPNLGLLPGGDPKEIEVYEPDDFERLLEAAKELDLTTYCTVLLGGEAGLRPSETAALRREDVDLKAKTLRVSRNFSARVETSPKTPKGRRTIELTARLAEALKVQLASHACPRVLVNAEGKNFFYQDLAWRVAKAEAKVGLRVRPKAALHRLRHTFGSRLAIAGATAKEIAELMGHKSIKETERYLHLARAYRGRAIRLLEPPAVSGDSLETGEAKERPTAP
jgi:integrase